MEEEISIDKLNELSNEHLIVMVRDLYFENERLKKYISKNKNNMINGYTEEIKILKNKLQVCYKLLRKEGVNLKGIEYRRLLENENRRAD